jgi:hypothetical protein
MKRLIFFISIAALVTPLIARLIREWTFQEMFAKSDLVVIATPIATVHTSEHTTLPDLSPAVAVSGVNTEFQVRLVLKGDQKMKKFVLHHYQLDHQECLINEPELVTFNSQIWGPHYLLFLTKEPDGRYSPVTGQTDPALYSVIQLPKNIDVK